MNARALFLLSGFILGAVAPAFASEADIPKDEWILIHALGDALRASDFSDCRVSIADNRAVEFSHGPVSVSLDLFARRTRITPGQESVSLSGYEEEENTRLVDTFLFRLSRDRRSIAGVTFRQWRIDHRNSGTVTEPNYRTVLVKIHEIRCQADRR
jgi:hypothetical protein